MIKYTLPLAVAAVTLTLTGPLFVEYLNNLTLDMVNSAAAHGLSVTK